MMAKRRGLGSSPSTHARRGAGAAQRAIAYSGDAARAIERRRCDKAYDHVLEATAAYGEHMVHVEATGTNHNREAAHNVYEARTRFKRACLR